MCFLMFSAVSFSEASANHGATISCLFLLVMLLHTVVVCSSPVIFVRSYKVTCSEKQSYIIKFLGHKKWP